MLTKVELTKEIMLFANPGERVGVQAQRPRYLHQVLPHLTAPREQPHQVKGGAPPDTPLVLELCLSVYHYILNTCYWYR